MKEKSWIFHCVHLTDVADKEMNVGKVEDGCVVFVSKAALEDIVDVQVRKCKKCFYQGILIDFHHYSERRNLSVFQYFEIHIGCKCNISSILLNCNSNNKELQDHLSRIGDFDLPPVFPILASVKTLSLLQ
ncbi:MAG: TRAM domain-containing protein [Flavobacteriales bacterium AspAUS03]